MLRDDFGRLPLCPLGRGACYSTLLELTVFTRFRYTVGEHCASGEGEAGFLLRPDSTAAKLVTALHNLMDEMDELGYDHFVRGTASRQRVPLLFRILDGKNKTR
jgi:hypothetical protein